MFALISTANIANAHVISRATWRCDGFTFTKTSSNWKGENSSAIEVRRNGKLLLRRQAHDLWLWTVKNGEFTETEDNDPFKTIDLNGDGVKDFIIRQWSGGAYCCYTYEIFSLQPNCPRLWHNNARSAHLKIELPHTNKIKAQHIKANAAVADSTTATKSNLTDGSTSTAGDTEQSTQNVNKMSDGIKNNTADATRGNTEQNTPSSNKTANETEYSTVGATMNNQNTRELPVLPHLKTAVLAMEDGSFLQWRTHTVDGPRPIVYLTWFQSRAYIVPKRAARKPNKKPSIESGLMLYNHPNRQASETWEPTLYRSRQCRPIDTVKFSKLKDEVLTNEKEQFFIDLVYSGHADAAHKLIKNIPAAERHEFVASFISAMKAGPFYYKIVALNGGKFTALSKLTATMR